MLNHVTEPVLYFYVQDQTDGESISQSSETSSPDMYEATISGQDGSNGLSAFPGILNLEKKSLKSLLSRLSLHY